MGEETEGAFETKYRDWMRARDDKEKRMAEAREQEFREMTAPAPRVTPEAAKGTTDVYARLVAEAASRDQKMKAKEKEAYDGEKQEFAAFRFSGRHPPTRPDAPLQWLAWKKDRDKKVNEKREEMAVEAEQEELASLSLTPEIGQRSRELARKTELRFPPGTPVYDRLTSSLADTQRRPLPLPSEEAELRRSTFSPEIDPNSRRRAPTSQTCVHDRLYANAARLIAKRNGQLRERWRQTTTFEVPPQFKVAPQKKSLIGTL